MPRKSKGKCRGQHGVTLLAVALVGSVMFSFVGLALDLGRAFILRSELQTFADTAALAAVSRLDSTGSGVQLAHTTATQGPLPTSAPNGVNFGTTVVSSATDTYATTFTGTYVSYATASASTSNTYRFIQVVASSNLHLYFLSLVPGIGSEMAVAVAATAGQSEKPGSFSNGGLSPFAPIAHDPYDTTAFGFTKGSKYTLKWDNHGATTCPGDAGFTPVGMPSAEHGFVDLGQGNGNSSLTGVIEYSGYPNANSTPSHVSVNDYLDDVTGNRGSAIFTSLSNRASQDSDQVSTTWAQYESAGLGNRRRIITVVMIDPSRGTGHGTNYASPVVGFGNFLLDPGASISGTSGPICATYLGPASSNGGTSGGSSGASVYTTMLFR